MKLVTLEKSASLLLQGNVGIVPTDTMYGVVASALNKEAVEHLYAIRKRVAVKPCIILIPSILNIHQFGIHPDAHTIHMLEAWWPGKVSVVLPCSSKQYEYLHRGTWSLAFRIPDSTPLRELLKRTGPIVAPSANIEGQSPARTIEEAYAYFGNSVDFYVDARELPITPSTLVSIKNKKVTLLRQGAVTISAQLLIPMAIFFFPW
ncbi:MAG: L-threonylcarbamoyladenylate synthase [bacterium]|nr:L-threonylcarbamoyladenylate synthase [bacterium]